MNSKCRKGISALLVLVFIFSLTYVNGINVVSAAQENLEELTQTQDSQITEDVLADPTHLEDETELLDSPVKEPMTDEQIAFAQAAFAEVKLEEKNAQVNTFLTPIPVEQFAFDTVIETPEEEENQPLEYVTHTQNEDGTNTATIYLSPVRYQKEDGDWAWIDTSIVKAETSAPLSYRNQGGPVDVFLAGNANEDNLAHIEMDGYSIAWEPVLDQEASLQNHASLLQETELELAQGQTAQASALGSDNAQYEEALSYEAIKYTRAFGIDQQEIRLKPLKMGVKEEIILHTCPAQEDFVFDLTLAGVYPVLREDNNLLFYDLLTDEQVAVMAAPYMYDSALESRESYDIDVTVQKTGENTYRYTLTPDRSWLEAAERVYPVTIDPTAQFKRSNAYETFVTKRYPNNNYYTDSHVKVGNSADLDISRGFFAMQNLQSTIGSNRYITSATFKAYEDYQGASRPEISLHAVSQTYDNETVTWNSQPQHYADVAAKTTVGNGWNTWDITKTIREWYAKAPVMTAFCMKLVSEGSNYYKRFRSESYDSSGTYDPRFEVTYVTAPSAPTSVTVSPTSWTKGEITVSWSGITQASGATLSGIQYSTTSATKGFANISGLSSSSFQSGQATLDLPDGQKNVWIRAKNSKGLYGAAKAAVYKRDKTGPNMPTGVKAEKNFSGPTGSFTITWNATTDHGVGLDHYQVGVSTDGGKTYPNKVDVGTNLTYTFTNLEDQTEYKFAVRAWDALGNYSDAAYTSSFYVGDYTPPTAPSTVTVAPSSWTNNTSPVLTWGGIQDVELDRAQYRIDSGAWTNLPKAAGTTSGSYVLSTESLDDGTHTISVRGIDAEGLTGTAKSTTYYKDTEAPIAILNIQDNTVISGSVTIAGHAKNSTVHSSFGGWRVEYAFGTQPTDSGSAWQTIATGTTEKNNSTFCTWNVSNLTQNQFYTLRLVSWDAAGNETKEAIRVLVSGDSMAVPAGLELNLDQDTAIEEELYSISFAPTDSTDTLSDEKLFANGALVATRAGASSAFLFHSDAYDEEANQWIFPDGQEVFLLAQAKNQDGEDLYSIPTYMTNKMLSNMSLSSFSSYSNISIMNGGATLQYYGYYVSPGYFIWDVEEMGQSILYLDLIVDATTYGAGTGISYTISYDNGSTWQTIEPVAQSGGSENLNNRVYLNGNVTGDSIQIKATLTGMATYAPVVRSIQLRMRTAEYAEVKVIENSFEEGARGFGLSNLEHDEENGQIVLAEGATSGSISSLIRQLPINVVKAVLVTEQTTPANTKITHTISTNGVTYQRINPGDQNDPSQWTTLTPGPYANMMSMFSGTSTASPSLQSWMVRVKVAAAGQTNLVQLVDDPNHLSALPEANYQVLLRWQPSETAGVTYNVYRSETPYFTPSDYYLIASGIEDCYWSDYNLNYGKTFYYQVTAVKTIDGHDRESAPSNQAWGTVVEQDEIEKRLGLQNYWGYSAFETGSGTGYVNVDNGNLVYTATDMVVSDPFFAMVMRRTFNSMATSKTPLGYGWDFSFNTTLMREYNASGQEVGMILKDGDGSFHRFAKNSSDGYDSAQGTLMELAYDETDQEYTITRRDNVTYHFDATTMKLKSFTDPNGHALTVTYDERGNVSQIENNIGDVLQLSYQDAASVPGSGDYIYRNEHVDMLEEVTWSHGEAEITYNYYYNDLDKLIMSSQKDGADGGALGIYVEQYAYPTNAQGFGFTITNPESQVYEVELDLNKRVSKATDPVDHYLEFDYDVHDASRNIDKTVVTNQNGATNWYETDEDGLVVEWANALDHVVSYTYNDQFQPTGMSYYKEINGTNQLISHTYSYDADGHLTEIAGPLSNYTQYGNYNAFHQPGWQKVREEGGASRILQTVYTYDNAGNLTQVTDPEGGTTKYEYGTVNGVGGYLTWEQDRNGKWTKYTYNNRGQVTDIKNYATKTGTQSINVAFYTYDDYGRVKTYVDTTQYAYPPGVVTEYTYDELGFLASESVGGYAEPSRTEYTYNKLGSLLKQTDPRGFSVRYTYDDIGRLTKTTYPDASEDTVSYGTWQETGSTQKGDKVTYTDGEGRTSTEYYNVAGQLVKSISGGVTTQYGYDEVGNMTSVNAGGRQATAAYNLLNQQTSVSYLDSTGTAVTTTTMAYNYVGNVTSEKDGEGNYTYYSYDKLGRLLTVREDPSGLNLQTTYEYDDQSQAGYTINRVIDAKGQVDETWFDAYGRMVKERSLANESSTTALKETEYSYYGSYVNPYLVTRQDGTKEKYSYDGQGRVCAIDYYAEGESTNGHADYRLTYTYDLNGNVLEEQFINGEQSESTRYAYDGLNRLMQWQQGLVVEEDGSQITEASMSLEYAYNDAGQISTVRYLKEDNQEGISYAGGGSTMRDIQYTYDTYGRPSQIKLDGDLVRSYSYDATTGDVTSVKDYRQFATDGSAYIDQTFTYDDIGRPTKLTYTDHAGSTSTKKEEYTLGYDANSMITSETVYTNYDEEKTVDKTYTYDAIGRLLSAVDGDTQTDYTYDEVGNRLTQKKKADKDQSGWDEQFTYSYNNLNQLTVIQKTADGKTSTHASYTYDDLGNQIKEVQQHLSVTVDNSTTTYNKTTTYEYDLRNQLSQVEVQTPQVADETTGTVTYTTDVTNNTYNASGQRIVKEENGKTTRYYYMGDNVLYTANEHNVLQTENILDLSGSIVASKRFLQPSEAESEEYANQYYFYHYDVRGSVTNILSPAGTVVKGYDYDEFGQSSKKGDDNFLNEMTFTGSVMDASSGLQYMNARYYQPSTGRFLSQDTYSGNPYDPWTHHLYVYTGNNPINFIDPTGHSIESLQRELEKATFSRNVYHNAMKNYDPVKNAELYLHANDKYREYSFLVNDLTREIHALQASSNGLAAGGSDDAFFGSSHTDIQRAKIMEPQNYVLFEMGSYVDVVEYRTGDSTKPLSVYSQTVNDDWTQASAGIVGNIKLNNGSRMKSNLNFGLSDISLSRGIVGADGVGGEGYAALDIAGGGFLKLGYRSYAPMGENSTMVDYYEIKVSAIAVLVAIVAPYALPSVAKGAAVPA